MKAKILTWEEFRNICEEDARCWYYNTNLTSDEITEEDIIGEYPEDYFSDDSEDDTDELSSAFTPEEMAAETIKKLKELEWGEEK